MITDGEALSILIGQNIVARESYYHRKGQELLPSKDDATTTARRELTKTADSAWQRAEAALWQHRAAHGAAAAPSRQLRPVRPVRGLFGSR